jgi:hypothetical protein
MCVLVITDGSHRWSGSSVSELVMMVVGAHKSHCCLAGGPFFLFGPF